MSAPAFKAGDRVRVTETLELGYGTVRSGDVGVVRNVVDRGYDAWGGTAYEVAVEGRESRSFSGLFRLYADELELVPTAAQSWVWVGRCPFKSTLSPAEVADAVATSQRKCQMLALPTHDGVETYIDPHQVTHIRAVEA